MSIGTCFIYLNRKCSTPGMRYIYVGFKRLLGPALNYD